jgi:hypothetical protein
MLKRIESNEEFLALKPDDEFIIKERVGGSYLLACGVGLTDRVEEAFRYNRTLRFYLIGYYSGDEMWKGAENNGFELLLILPDIPCVQAPISVLFTANQIELMKLAPRADAVRSSVMAKVGQMPPEELADFEALKTWIEANAKPSAALRVVGTSNNQATLPIRFNWSGTEYGTCTYRCRMAGYTEESFRAQDIERLAAENDVESLNDLLVVLIQDNREDHSEGDVLEADGENKYEGHNQSEDSLEDVEVAIASLSNTIALLKEFIRQNCPETAERIGL